MTTNGLGSDEAVSVPSTAARSATPPLPPDGRIELSTIPPTRNGATPTPPPPEGLVELSSIPPTRDGVIAPPSIDIDMYPELFDGRKYRRSSVVPDYRASMFPELSMFAEQEEPAPMPVVASKPATENGVNGVHGVNSKRPRGNSELSAVISPISANVPAFATNPRVQNKVSSRRDSDASAFVSTPISQKPAQAPGPASQNGTSSRRNSDLPVFAKAAAVAAVNGRPSRRISEVPAFSQSATAVNGKSSRRNSDLPAFAQATAVANGRSSRRNTDLPVFAKRAATMNAAMIDAATNGAPNGTPNYTTNGPTNDVATRPSRVYSEATSSPRAVSPESRRNGVNARSGAVSPVTYRSISPVGFRNGAVSPNRRSSSPAPRVTSPLARDSNAEETKKMHHMAALQKMQGLSLNTQVPPANVDGPKKAEEEAEDMDEVISLSPVVRAPIKNFRRSRSSLALSAALDGGHPTLDSVAEDGPGFGQEINLEDLVAVNLENAFDRL